MEEASGVAGSIGGGRCSSGLVFGSGLVCDTWVLAGWQCEGTRRGGRAWWRWWRSSAERCTIDETCATTPPISIAVLAAGSGLVVDSGLVPEGSASLECLERRAGARRPVTTLSAARVVVALNCADDCASSSWPVAGSGLVCDGSGLVAGSGLVSVHQVSRACERRAGVGRPAITLGAARDVVALSSTDGCTGSSWQAAGSGLVCESSGLVAV